MRISFQQLERAKKAAKSLVASTNAIKLSKAQETVAKLAGYRDWHDLTKNHCGKPSSTCTTIQQEELSKDSIISLTLALSEELALRSEDALYALVQMKLPGIHVTDAQKYEELWLQLFKETQPFQGYKCSPGKVIKIKSESKWMNGAQAILKKYEFGGVAHILTHKAPDSLVADFEVVFPSKPLSLFVPARLKFAYGCWTEASGSKVLFSRDYKPLWRLTTGRKPEKLPPWLWINKVAQDWYWDDTNTPWHSVHRRDEEEQRLRDFGISALPKLADTLSDLVFDENVNRVNEAVKLMARREDPGEHETFSE